MSQMDILFREWRHRGSRLSAAAVLGTLVVPCFGQGQTPAPTPAPARQSTVHYADGLLTVTATNASLNSILREISQSTGMKISGRAPDGPVFGTYGPEDPQKLMSELLDGTGTNILIVSNQADKPLELVLTRRSGGVTPPNPNATSEDGTDDDAQPQQTFTGASQSAAPASTNSGRRFGPSPSNSAPPAGAQPSEVSQPVVFAPIGTTTAPATGTTTPVNPDDATDPSTDSVKTPQQIFEQLQKLQQQGNGSNGNTDQPQ